MKRIILFGLILVMMVLISGCGVTKVDVHIETDKNAPTNPIIKPTDMFRLIYLVVNPSIDTTFIGTVNYSFDSNCLVVVGYPINNTIEVNPNDKKPVIKEFRYNGYPPYPIKEQCLNVPLKITLILNDKSGLFKDSYETILRIVE